MAFIPSDNGQQLDVVLLNVKHAHHLSDGSPLGKHNSMLISRAGTCTGDCPTNDGTTAQLIFPDKTLTQAQAALVDATSGGGAWILNGSHLTVQKGGSNAPALPGLTWRTGVRPVVNGVPAAYPTTATEREDYSWLADMQQICGSGCTFDADLIGSNPPEDLVVACFRLRSGKAYTYSVGRIGDNVLPVKFKRLDGSGTATSAQAVATWVGVDIEVSGDSIEIVEEKFDATGGRSMKLTPDANDRVELAVLNLPPFVPPASASTLAPQAGKHFEAFYDLLTTAPAKDARLVPIADNATSVNWALVHPHSSVNASPLLAKLRLDISRGPYDRLLCPPVGGGTP
ncbi:MAG TPA: hypothetical protein VF618_13570 [Thermoanaerobaculia bacterium]